MLPFRMRLYGSAKVKWQKFSARISLLSPVISPMFFKEGQFEKESNMQILHITLSKFKPTQVYSLDVIISVGYRVKSKRGTQFRIRANQVS